MKWLITGGAGFIGCNTVRRLSEQGDDLIIFDNLARRGAKENLRWIRRLAIRRSEIVYLRYRESSKGIPTETQNRC